VGFCALQTMNRPRAGFFVPARMAARAFFCRYVMRDRLQRVVAVLNALRLAVCLGDDVLELVRHILQTISR
jgi:hypothetical protein